MSRRFTVSYCEKKDIEGVEFSDKSVYLNDSWVSAEFGDIEDVIKTLSQNGKCQPVITWIDAEVEHDKAG